MLYYYADRVRPVCFHWSRPRCAHVLHGTHRGRFVAITIRIPGTGWICHPSPDGDIWNRTRGTSHKNPPRSVRKAAKMALRRWLSA